MMAVGILLIGSACTIVFFNVNGSEKAGIRSQNIVSEIEASAAVFQSNSLKDYNEGKIVLCPARESQSMNYQFVSDEGLRFTGILTIPQLELTLPVCSDFSMENMTDYPCIYSGDLSDDNVIIAAHNYSRHFGSIGSLDPGDKIILKTVSGTENVYEVFSVDIIPGDRKDEMISGDWDLTLFTCTINGVNRVTVRCLRDKW